MNSKSISRYPIPHLNDLPQDIRDRITRTWGPTRSLTLEAMDVVRDACVYFDYDEDNGGWHSPW